MIDQLYKIWNLKPHHVAGNQFTGYESIQDQLNTFTKCVYEKDPESTIEQVFSLYRGVNLVPITYYTETGLVRAISDFASAKYNTVSNSRLGLGNNHGQGISRFLFPNMMTAEPKGRGSNSLRDRFYDDTKLRRAIRICFEFRDGANLVGPVAMRRALELVTGENVTNFKAANARAIVEYLCPVMWGSVYDYSCGYGGRLLGTAASRMQYNYIGVDPNTETVKYLNYYSNLIEEATGRHHEILCETSQNHIPENIDCAFSSPPYFNLEKYSDEPTQCMVEFQSLDEWFEGYAEPTIRNIYSALVSGGVFATNIADYKSYGNKEYAVVDRWVQTAEKIGFRHSETVKMMLNTRPGVGNDKTAGREKWEGVYVFTK